MEYYVEDNYGAVPMWEDDNIDDIVEKIKITITESLKDESDSSNLSSLNDFIDELHNGCGTARDADKLYRKAKNTLGKGDFGLFTTEYAKYRNTLLKETNESLSSKLTLDESLFESKSLKEAADDETPTELALKAASAINDFQEAITGFPEDFYEKFNIANSDIELLDDARGFLYSFFYNTQEIDESLNNKRLKEESLNEAEKPLYKVSNVAIAGNAKEAKKEWKEYYGLNLKVVPDGRFDIYETVTITGTKEDLMKLLEYEDDLFDEDDITPVKGGKDGREAKIEYYKKACDHLRNSEYAVDISGITWRKYCGYPIPEGLPNEITIKMSDLADTIDYCIEHLKYRPNFADTIRDAVDSYVGDNYGAYPDWEDDNVDDIVKKIKTTIPESLKRKSNKKLNEDWVIKVTDIDWDTDGEDVDLPTEVDIPYYDLDLDGTEEDDYIIEDEISEYLSDVYGWLHNGFDYEVINESLKRNLKESSNDDVTIGIYGDEVDGFRSVNGLVDYFTKKGIKVSDVDGDFDYGWEMNLTGNPRQLFFAVANTIPGYNSDSVQEFIDEYRIDESFKNKSKKNHKTINEAYIVSDFSAYEPWSGAVDTFNKIKDAGKLDALEALIDETNPTGIYETELNDLLWFEADWVFQQLGMEDQIEDTDESLKEAETQLYHTTYIIGSPDKADAIDEANLLEKEYRGSNIEFKPVKVDAGTWGVDFIGSYEDVLKVAKDFKPLGEFMEEPYTDYIKPVKKVNNIELPEGLNNRKKTIGSLMQRLLSKNRYTEVSFWCPDVFWEQPFFEGVVEDVPDKYTNVPMDYYEKDSGIYQIYISPEDMLPEDMREVEEMKDYYEKNYPPVHSTPMEKYLEEGASKNRDYDTDEWSVIYYELSAETNEPSYDKVLARKALVNVPKRQKYDKVDPVNDYDLRVYAKDEESFELAKKVANAHGLKYKIEPTNKVHASRFPQEAFQLTLYIPEEKIQSQ